MENEARLQCKTFQAAAEELITPERSPVTERLSYGSGQLAVGSGRWAVGSGQLAVGGWQGGHIRGQSLF